MVEIDENTNLDDLMILLKQEIKEVTLEDLYDLSFHFNEEQKYLPREYKKRYNETVLNVIINRFTSLKNNQKKYEGSLNKEDIININKLLNNKENIVTHILNITVIYATYFLKEPIHMPETTFPGNVSIFSDGLNYYCPIKHYHIDDDNALCNICIAKATKD
jgi:uncharacterized protein (UPF0305 family)